MGRTLLLIVVDGLLHVGDSLLEGLGNARHGLGILLLEFGGTGLHQLLGHVLETLLVALQLFFHLLAHQFQLSALRLGTGM